MVTDKSYWMGRDTKYANELTQMIRDNANELLRRVNGLLVDLGRSPIVEKVNSGWRPASLNAIYAKDPKVHAATHSSHMDGKAVDITDDLGELEILITAHPELLKKHMLNREDPASTPGWCHLDSRDGLGYRTFKI